MPVQNRPVSPYFGYFTLDVAAGNWSPPITLGEFVATFGEAANDLAIGGAWAISRFYPSQIVQLTEDLGSASQALDVWSSVSGAALRGYAGLEAGVRALEGDYLGAATSLLSNMSGILATESALPLLSEFGPTIGIFGSAALGAGVTFGTSTMASIVLDAPALNASENELSRQIFNNPMSPQNMFSVLGIDGVAMPTSAPMTPAEGLSFDPSYLNEGPPTSFSSSSGMLYSTSFAGPTTPAPQLATSEFGDPAATAYRQPAGGISNSNDPYGALDTSDGNRTSSFGSPTLDYTQPSGGVAATPAQLGVTPPQPPQLDASEGPVVEHRSAYSPPADALVPTDRVAPDMSTTDETTQGVNWDAFSADFNSGSATISSWEFDTNGLSNGADNSYNGYADYAYSSSYGYGDYGSYYGDYGYGDYGYGYGDYGYGDYYDYGYPVVLDLSGQGIKINPVTSSNSFFDMAGDGFEHRTATPGVGNAALVLDLAGNNQITQRNQLVFTEWDPSATNDMQALRDVFDTNHNGKLDSGDTDFSKFKLAVMNADGTRTMETLAQAGVASINLTPDQTSIVFSDGSAINGETTFTRTDGTTGVAADATFAYDPNGYTIRTTTTHNADGSTTIETKGLNPDGTPGNDTVTTTSADGKTIAISFDLDGDGVVDRRQSDVTVANSGGGTTETLNDTTGAGLLMDRTVTTKSADGKTVTIQRDASGGGWFQQSETDVSNADGSKSVTLADLNPNGTQKDATVTTVSADGQTKTQQDFLGTSLEETETHAVSFDVASNRIVWDLVYNADGSLRNDSALLTTPDGRSTVRYANFDGTGDWDRINWSTTTNNADGSSTTTETDYSSQYAVLDRATTTVSADGLSHTTQTDFNGDGVTDLTHTDTTTVDAAGNRTETITDGGTSKDKVVDIRYADGRQQTITTDSNGDGITDKVEYVTIDSTGLVNHTIFNYNRDSSISSIYASYTSADGKSTTEIHDYNGDWGWDLTTTTSRAANADGSTTTTVSDTNQNGSLRDRTITTTSADGHSSSVQSDINGDGVVDLTTTDSLVRNSDASATETLSDQNGNGSLRDKAVTTVSADRNTTTVNRDGNGDGAWDETESIVRNADGVVVDATYEFNPDGSLKDEVVKTVTADGLTKYLQQDVNGDGGYTSFDLTTTDSTVLDPGGSSVETITDTNADGSIRGRMVVTTSANGLSKTTQSDLDGNGSFDLTTTDSVVFNADASRTETISELNGNGTLRDKTVITTSGNGLAKTTQLDIDGIGGFDRTQTDVTVINADGSRTETITDRNANGTLRDQKIVSTTPDGNISTQLDSNGDGHFDVYTFAGTSGNNVVQSVADNAPDGHTYYTATTAMNMNGTSGSTASHDGAPTGIIDRSQGDTVTFNADGSRSETVSTMNGTYGALVSRTTTTTSANGLSKMVQSDLNGDGSIDLTTSDVKVLNSDGSNVETVTETNVNNSLRGRTVTTVSADDKTTTITRDVNGDNLTDQTETIALQPNGSRIDTISDLNANGSLKDRKIVTTSASGLSVTTQFDTNGDGAVDETQIDATVLNNSGSRTETRSMSSASVNQSVVTTTSANGLSKSVQVSGVNGQPSSSSTDVIVLNADGSRVETISDFAASGSLMDRSITTTSGNGLSKTVQLDPTGSGTYTSADTTIIAVDGSVTETLTLLNSNQSPKQKDILTTSADGLTQSLQRDTNGDNIFDHFETTSLASDGSTVDTIWEYTPAATLKDRIVTTTSADGLSKTVNMDSNGDGAADLIQVAATILNTDGTKTSSVSDYNGNSTLRDRTVTTTSANGLSKTSQIDTNGDGAIDEVTTDTILLNADGTQTETETTRYADNSLKATTTTSVSANGLTRTVQVDTNGDGVTDRTDTTVTAINGSRTQTITYASAGTSVVTTTSADGLTTTVARSNTATDTTVAAADGYGSYSWYSTEQEVDPTFAQAGLTYLDLVETGFAAHNIDATGTDTWQWSEAPYHFVPTGQTTTLTVNGIQFPVGIYAYAANPSSFYTVKIDLATEAKDVAIAARLYDTALDRDMTQSEHQFLAKYISNGTLNTTQLATDLMASTEFNQKYGTLTNAQFIERISQNAFGHGASVADLNTYLSQLSAGTVTRAGLVATVAESAEHLADGDVHAITNNTATGSPSATLDHTTDKQVAANMVTRLYDTVFDRDPSAAELNAGSGKLVSGAETEAQLANDLVSSAEFLTRFGALSNTVFGPVASPLSNNDFAAQLLMNTLGKGASGDVIQADATLLANGTLTRADLADALSQSPDHLAGGNGHSASPYQAGTETFNFNFVDTTLSYGSNGHAYLAAPGGTSYDVTGVAHLVFNDGRIDEADGQPLVDDLFYDSAYKDVYRAGVDPDTHYGSYGWHEGRNPNAEFNTNYYLSAYGDVAAADVNPLTHYDMYGWHEGRNPSASFSTSGYLSAYPDVAAQNVDPLQHYLQYGASEGRLPL